MNCFCVECGDEMELSTLLQESGLSNLSFRSIIFPFAGRASEIYDENEDRYYPNILQFDEETFMCPACCPAVFARYRILLRSLSDRQAPLCYPAEVYLPVGAGSADNAIPPLPGRDPNCNCNRCSGERP